MVNNGMGIALEGDMLVQQVAIAQRIGQYLPLCVSYLHKIAPFIYDHALIFCGKTTDVQSKLKSRKNGKVSLKLCLQ